MRGFGCVFLVVFDFAKQVKVKYFDICAIIVFGTMLNISLETQLKVHVTPVWANEYRREPAAQILTSKIQFGDVAHQRHRKGAQPSTLTLCTHTLPSPPPSSPSFPCLQAAPIATLSQKNAAHLVVCLLPSAAVDWSPCLLHQTNASLLFCCC